MEGVGRLPGRLRRNFLRGRFPLWTREVYLPVCLLTYRKAESIKANEVWNYEKRAK